LNTLRSALKRKEQLEGELSSVGRINPSKPERLGGTPGTRNTLMWRTRIPLADKFEGLRRKKWVEVELEVRFNENKAALMNGKRQYGVSAFAKKK